MDKIAIISGGSSGLGFELAKKIVQKKLKVVILGRDEAKLQKAAKFLNSIISNSAIHFACNIANEDKVKELYQKLVKDYQITHLFNCAGVGKSGKAEDVTQDMIDEVFAANLKGMILLCSHLLKNTSKNNGAMIVNIMSTSALLGRAEESVYCAAKWGARGYTESLKVYAKGTNYKVIAIYPGGMDTAFWDDSDSKPDVSKFMNPEEVAGKIINSCFDIETALITDLTINRIQ
jgi:short-subunit dehydrogenase